MKIDRKEMASAIEHAAMAGGETLEMFGGEVICTDNEAWCWTPSPLGGLEAAAAMAVMQAVAGKTGGDSVTIAKKGDELTFRGKGWRSGVALQDLMSPHHLDVSAVEWRPLPEELIETIQAASKCASRDEDRFVLTCVHVRGDGGVEACDNFQAVRFIAGAEIGEMLLSQRAVKLMAKMKPTEIGQDDCRVYLRNGDRYAAAAKYEGRYPELDRLMDARDGREILLPAEVGEAAGRVAAFLVGEERPVLSADISDGKIIIGCRGESGQWYEEKVEMACEEAVKFRVAPELLAEVVRRGGRCVVSEDVLAVDDGTFRYVTALEAE